MITTGLYVGAVALRCILLGILLRLAMAINHKPLLPLSRLSYYTSLLAFRLETRLDPKSKWPALVAGFLFSLFLAGFPAFVALLLPGFDSFRRRKHSRANEGGDGDLLEHDVAECVALAIQACELRHFIVQGRLLKE